MCKRIVPSSQDDCDQLKKRNKTQRALITSTEEAEEGRLIIRVATINTDSDNKLLSVLCVHVVRVSAFPKKLTDPDVWSRTSGGQGGEV